MFGQGGDIIHLDMLRRQGQGPSGWTHAVAGDWMSRTESPGPYIIDCETHTRPSFNYLPVLPTAPVSTMVLPLCQVWAQR